MRIYLTGFMGSGKTAVGRVLAARLGVPFLDLDREIERRAGRTIAEIFGRDGEPAFRRLEAEVLRATAARPRLVAATGGGAVVAAANREWIAAHGVSVWLHPDFATILDRLGRSGGGARPLFRDPEQAEALYRRRLKAYRTADFEVRIDGGETPEETAARIDRMLGEERRCAT